MASALPTTAPETRLHAAVRQGVTRVFLKLALAASVVSLPVMLAAARWGDYPPPLPTLATMLGLLVLCLAGLRSGRQQSPAALRLVLLYIVLMSGIHAYLNGRGLQGPALMFFSLTLAMIGAIDSRRFTTLITALAVAVLVSLAAAEWQGQLAAPSPPVPLAIRLLGHVVMVLVGAALGRAMAWLMTRHDQEIAQRERRFRALLAVAGDVYWELDQDLRLSRVELSNSRGELQEWPVGLGGSALSLPALRMDDASIARARAVLAARQPLRELAFSWQLEDGTLRHMLANGEPRSDDSGRFAGYWGVARDISAAARAQSEMAATEQRYQLLFKHMPSPLVLHRDGLIVAANLAAARLLGYARVEDMRGRDAVKLHLDDGARAESRQPLATLGDDAAGPALPLIERELIRCDGSRVQTLSTTVRVDHGGTPATLELMIDQTDGRAAALAAMRSQGLLAKVVAISPDIISLSEAVSGRFVMVNDSFCRTFGQPAEAVIGKTALEIQLWRDPANGVRLWAENSGRASSFDRVIEFNGPGGQPLKMQVSVVRFSADGQDYLLVNARNITESARLRQEYEAILANASIGIAFTRDRHFVLANPQFEQMFGWSPGSLIGQPGRVVWPSDDDYASVGTAIGPALSRGEPVEIEHIVLRRDGSSFLVRLAGRAIDPKHPTDGGTIWISEDVTERRRAQQALALALDQAEAANRAKSAFLANTSHEIRTPLNGLVGLAQLARQPDLEPARRMRYLDLMADSAQTLSAIISDILDLSRIEAGKLELTLTPFDLPALLEALQQAWRPLATERGLEFTLRLDSALPHWVLGDATRLRQVLANLLHNALKFTDSGAIGLAARPLADGRVQLQVHDTGPGIDSATQAGLFVPFTQADQSITRRFGGSGLGLSICRQLAGLMDGQLVLDSTPGQGSRFTLELPLPPAAPAPSPGPVGGNSQPLRGGRVLVVEDNAVNMMLVVALLEHWGATAVEAEDGRQALAAVASADAEGRPFQAVLMDLQMPDMSGYQATEQLRRSHSAEQLPVIALTAAVLVSEREQALAAGMLDFVTKPIDTEHLLSCLLRAGVGAAAQQPPA